MPDTQLLPSVFQTSALDPVGRADPHPRLDLLREKCPVLFDKGLGGFFLTRHVDIRAVLLDPTLWRAPDKADEGAVKRLKTTLPEASRAEHEHRATLLLMDDPDHGRLRRLFAEALYKRAAMSRDRIMGIVAAAIDAVAERAQFDVVAEFAEVIPIASIASLLGVENDRLAQFRQWACDSMLLFHPLRSAGATERMLAAQDSLRAYFMGLIEARRVTPGEDIVSDLVQRQRHGAPITDEELQLNLRGLLSAGVTTTTDLIGNLIWLLLSHPDQRAHLMRDPSLIGVAVEEALRFEPPVDLTTRIASRDMAVGGCPVRTRQAMSLSIRAANRDPDVFERPHVFDIMRPRRGHIAFGGGTHICIGAPFARLQVQTAVSMLFERLSNLRLQDPLEPPHWRALPMFRGLSRLMAVP